MSCQPKITVAVAIILATSASVWAQAQELPQAARQEQGSQLLPGAEVPFWIKPDSEPEPVKAGSGGNKATLPRSVAKPERTSESGSTARPAQCDYSMCASKYRSFDSSSCTYQPYTGGPRRLCEP